jgi:RimJ/RimL family protein N-acetyltransferase
VIGFADFKYLPKIDETDIGFRILPEYWNTGIVSVINAKLIPYGFNQLKLKRIIGIALPENKASCRVLEKAGLVLYKTDNYMDEGIIWNWYVITERDFKSKTHPVN